MNKQTILAASTFNTLPDAALVPVGAAALVCGRGVSTIWRETKAGRFPAPIKVARSTRWRVGDVRAWLKSRG